MGITLNRTPPRYEDDDVRIPLVADVPGPPDRRGRGSGRPAAGREQDPSDEQIVRRILDGDSAALGSLYDRYGRPAYSLARRICADEGLAEDVVQEAFLAFWRNPGRFDAARGSFGTWLLTLVHHKSVDAVRRESTIRRRTVLLAVLGAVVAGQVRDALGRLPAEQRQALALAYYGGYTQREVAALTGVPLGTVKSRMFTGVQRLRTLLGPLLGDVAADIAGGAR
jgi:DNA-directed RNA polymerase specialized sigma24 family protein